MMRIRDLGYEVDDAATELPDSSAAAQRRIARETDNTDAAAPSLAVAFEDGATDCCAPSEDFVFYPFDPLPIGEDDLILIDDGTVGGEDGLMDGDGVIFVDDEWIGDDQFIFVDDGWMLEDKIIFVDDGMAGDDVVIVDDGSTGEGETIVIDDEWTGGDIIIGFDDGRAGNFGFYPIDPLPIDFVCGVVEGCDPPIPGDIGAIEPAPCEPPIYDCQIFVVDGIA
jgi:hypothetical protein